MAKDTNDGAAEAVAYQLARDIMQVEERHTGAKVIDGWQPADRKYLLDLYAECREAVAGNRAFDRPAGPDGETVGSGPRVRSTADWTA